MADAPLASLTSLFTLRVGQSGDPPAVGYLPSTPDGGAQVVLGGGDGRLRSYALALGVAPRLLWESRTSQGVWITDLALFPQSSRGVTSGRDGSLWLWSLEDGAHLGTFEGHGEWVFSIAASPDGTRVASVGDDGLLKIWGLGSPKPLLTQAIPKGEPVLATSPQRLGEGAPNGLYALAWSPDGAHLALGDFAGVITLIEAWSGALCWRRQGIDDIPWSLAFSPDGRRLALGTGGAQVGIMDAATGDMTLLPHKDPGALPGVGWLGNRYVVAGGEGRQLVVQGVDGTLVATGSFPEETLWKLRAPGQGRLILTTHPGDLCRGWGWKDTLLLPRGASPQ